MLQLVVVDGEARTHQRQADEVSLRHLHIATKGRDAEQQRERIHADALKPTEFAGVQVLEELQEQAAEGGEHRHDPCDLQREGGDAVAQPRPALASRRRPARDDEADHDQHHERVCDQREHRVPGVDDTRGRYNCHRVAVAQPHLALIVFSPCSMLWMVEEEHTDDG